MLGFIPVHTGEPNLPTGPLSNNRVYPRAYGGAYLLLQVISRDWGLSPCIRGSLAAGHVDTDGLGFIPVHTGEPVA